MHGGEALVFMTFFLSGFAMLFGIYYLKTRQNMAMIEKGMHPRQFLDRPTPYKNLKWALLLIGAGMGLFLAYILSQFVLLRYGSYTTVDGVRHSFIKEDNPAVYFALIAIGGGIGLFMSYKIEKKWWDDNKETNS